MMKDKTFALPILFVGTFSAFLFLLSACEKEKERSLGKDVLAEDQRLESGVTDSFQVEARSVTMPAVPALNSEPAMLGRLQDPRTGVTRSSFYTQLLLPATNIDLGDPADLVLDSIVLSLRYEGYYGETSTSQKFQAYQVLESMDGIDPDHRDSLEHSLTPIGSDQFAPMVNQNDQLRIPLKDGFGEKILDRSGSSDLSNDDAFTDFINGIMVTSRTPSQKDGEGSILFANIPNEQSRVRIYYRNTAQNDTSSLDLDVDGTHYNRIHHKPTGSNLESKLDEGFSKKVDRCYVLGPGEVGTELRFPNITSFGKDQGVSVNRAILKLPVDPVPNVIPFSPSTVLKVLYRDSSDNLQLTKDRIQEGPQFIGGSYDGKAQNYEMTITRHVQAMVDGDVPNKLFISTSIPFREEAAANTASRTVLKGPGALEHPVLEITYTEY